MYFRRRVAREKLLDIRGSRHPVKETNDRKKRGDSKNHLELKGSLGIYRENHSTRN